MTTVIARKASACETRWSARGGYGPLQKTRTRIEAVEAGNGGVNEQTYLIVNGRPHDTVHKPRAAILRDDLSRRRPGRRLSEAGGLSRRIMGHGRGIAAGGVARRRRGVTPEQVLASRKPFLQVLVRAAALAGGGWGARCAFYVGLEGSWLEPSLAGQTRPGCAPSAGGRQVGCDTNTRPRGATRPQETSVTQAWVTTYLDTVRARGISVALDLPVLAEDAREDPRCLPRGRSRGRGRGGARSRGTRRGHGLGLFNMQHGTRARYRVVKCPDRRWHDGQDLCPGGSGKLPRNEQRIRVEEIGEAAQTLSPESPEMPRIADFRGKVAKKKVIRYCAKFSTKSCLVDGLGGSGGPMPLRRGSWGKSSGGGVALR